MRPSFRFFRIPYTDGISLFPEGEELGDQFRGILQVGVDLYGGRTFRREIPGEDRLLESVVAGEPQAPDAVVVFSEAGKDRERVVGRVVVGEEEFEAVLPGETVCDIANPFIQGRYVVGLVVDGDDDRDQGRISHHPLPHPESIEPCGRPHRQLISVDSILWPR